MENLIKSLETFSNDPSEVGNQLFSFFSQITNMNWENASAAAGAIASLTREAFDASGQDLQNAKFKRLKDCREVAESRLITLISQAPKEQQMSLWLSAKASLGGVSQQMMDLRKIIESGE